MHFYSLWFSGDFVGRHRWVEYAEKGRYNASQVPAEWHGWLHYITDNTGDEASRFPYFVWYLVSRKKICAQQTMHLFSFWCWNQRGMGLSTRKTFLERVKSWSIIPRDMPLIQGRETGPDTNHGNPPSLKPFLQPKSPVKLGKSSGYLSPRFMNKCLVPFWSFEILTHVSLEETVTHLTSLSD